MVMSEITWLKNRKKKKKPEEKKKEREMEKDRYNMNWCREESELLRVRER